MEKRAERVEGGPKWPRYQAALFAIVALLTLLYLHELVSNWDQQLMGASLFLFGGLGLDLLLIAICLNRGGAAVQVGNRSESGFWYKAGVGILLLCLIIGFAIVNQTPDPRFGD